MKKFIIVAVTVSLTYTVFFGLMKAKNFVVATNAQTTFAVKEPFFKKLKAHVYKITKRSNVYEFLRKSYYTFGIPRKGIIHIGAREAEELPYYLEFGIEDILWVEADPTAEEALKKATSKHSGSKIALIAATDKTGPIELHRTSNHGHSSSILDLGKHSQYYPEIVETESFTVSGYAMDEYLSAEQKSAYNVLVMDIQGAELIALKGATAYLDEVDAIIAEVNFDELYKDCVLLPELDEFLTQQGFTRIDTVSVAYYTGDALYVKNKFLAK